MRHFISISSLIACLYLISKWIDQMFHNFAKYGISKMQSIIVTILQKSNKLITSIIINNSRKASNINIFAFQLSLLVYGRLQVTQKVEGLTSAIHNLAWIKTYQKEVEEWILKNYEQNQPGSASAITVTSFLIIIPILLTRFY